MNHELRNIISGIGKIAERNLIQTTLFFIRESERTSGTIEKSELVHKEDEVEKLTLFATQNQLWYQNLNESTYIGEGAEQKVYLEKDGKNVIKIK
jgi:Serine/Threonine/Tyrosine Kinase found in polyvalent proteins